MKTSDSSASTSVRALHNGQPGQSSSCCIGVLSAFEEKYLCKEDKDAIIQGGCHGLCGSQLNYAAQLNNTASVKSSPYLRYPHDKPARFVSTIPSNITSKGRRGPTSTQPQLSRRRIAAEYKQPRQALPVAERPVRKVRFDPALPPTPSEISAMKPSQLGHSQTTNNVIESLPAPASGSDTSPAGQSNSLDQAPLTTKLPTTGVKQHSDGKVGRTSLEHGIQEQSTTGRQGSSMIERDKKKHHRGRRVWTRFPGMLGRHERVSEA